MSEKPGPHNSESSSEHTAHEHPPEIPAPIQPFSKHFFDRSPAGGVARAIYFKTMFGGVTALCVVIFAIFSIYWGSTWKIPDHTLPGWIVDFDGGFIGQGVSQALAAIDPGSLGIYWEVVPASQFPGGIAQLEDAVTGEAVWYGLAINVGSSANLTAAIASATTSYNSSTAVTFLGSEARNENMYPIHRTIAMAQLEGIMQQFALQMAHNVSSASNVVTLLSNAPQIVTRPVGYTVNNLRPFDVPVASAVTFVGLIYLLILSFFTVMVSSGARAASGVERTLTLGSLIRLRIATSFVAYFVLALFYTLLSRAFQLPFDRRFGPGGIVLFWMLNWIGMLACGLALEAMITILTIRFVPFFLILWIISNVSISIFPLQVLPRIYRYGYAFPFYNIQRVVRTIVFSTKNDVGLNFGILIAWVAISCITLPLFQWFVRRPAPSAERTAVSGV
ncbi:hypothetical protein C8F04DRAFT_1084500 [Mycena alexandri]|uniref:DUF3533 domain-containing protein n=1 Tax=Mycena alexandri TaxID=1745969 RepID=A0AAD6T9X0_9AGAR|nr:hypothetical protein C8F04DRAFT_1084500 [Mycena alexandri]